MSDKGRIWFTGSSGARLAARMEWPLGKPKAFAVFAHCFTCSKDLKAARTVTRALADEGFAVMRFDFAGLGESEGDFADTNFSSNLADLIAAADYLRQEHQAPALLVGHSLGGAAVVAAARHVDEVRAVATIGAPADPRHLVKLLESKTDEIEAEGEAEVELAGRTFKIKRQLLEDLETQTLEECLAGLRRALLVMHSPIDNIVGIDHARQLFDAAQHPKSFITLDNADHLLTRESDAKYVGTVLAAWASRYMETPQMEPTEPGVVVVSGAADGFLQTIHAGPHTLHADEPADVGGGNLGPDPYQFLLAALGTCTSMTMAMYARRKEWPLEHVTVRMRQERIYARDCEECESEDGFVHRIHRELALEGPLDAEQTSRLMEIADRCPVHKTLAGEIVVDTTLQSD